MDPTVRTRESLKIVSGFRSETMSCLAEREQLVEGGSYGCILVAWLQRPCWCMLVVS
jgi:hypothetical protein